MTVGMFPSKLPSVGASKRRFGQTGKPSPVQPPDREMQLAREAHPHQIRHHQPACRLRVIEERDCCSRDRQPQRDELSERPAGLVDVICTGREPAGFIAA